MLDKKPGKFEVGVHPIKYPMKDAFGNLYPTECEFNIEAAESARPQSWCSPFEVGVVEMLAEPDFAIRWLAVPDLA